MKSMHRRAGIDSGKLGAARASAGGFTIVELLVVIATVTLLVAVTLPGLAGSLEAARRVQCASNQHQLVTAGHTYANDNRGAWCIARAPMLDSSNSLWVPVSTVSVAAASATSAPTGGYRHYGQLYDSYLTSAETYFCPSAPSFTRDDQVFGVANLGKPDRATVGSYMARGLPQGAPQTAQDRPAVVVTADLLGIPRHGYADNHPRRMANLAFLDGSVRLLQASRGWSFGVDVHGNDSAPGAADGAWRQFDRMELD